MKELTAYKCDNCDAVHSKMTKIYECPSCNKETCDDCVGLISAGLNKATTYCPHCHVDFKPQ